MTQLADLSWTREQLIELCIAIEAVCPPFGCHVAMTGGCLYKSGPRKDADLIFYRVRQRKYIDVDGLFRALAPLGLKRLAGFRWCWKFQYEGKRLDFLFPEEDKLKTTIAKIPVPDGSGWSKRRF